MAFDWQAELAAPLGRTIVNHTSSAATVPPPPKPVQKISFAQALTASTITTASNDSLPQPLICGDTVSIHITHDIYEICMDFCKRNLRGRLVLNKGDKPYTTKDIYSKLHNHWKTKGAWSITSLGRGYYEFFFSSEEDMRMTWAMGAINLKPGHDISSCRWLYPKKGNIVHKKILSKAKKPAPVPKQTWAPIKDNLSGIGSSIAFAAPQTNKDPVIAEAEAHTITVQQQDIP
ncbi:DUF4283 domain protein [Medicago truncatula]|uniref:DUF4283 domain protein n=1 Tax=Medicago truncatula TaxID=3880 RepID=A0A072VRA6_MEDTR|nr:DUF4283 domain protein [Medicago truncatula]